MTKRISVVLMLLMAGAPLLRADWKSELLSRLGRTPDYRAAYDYLIEASKKLEPEDKQTAGVLLPFLASKLGDVVQERDLAADYFETYRDYDPNFGFLDEYTLRDFIAFWARWKRSYPLVYDLNLLSYAKGPATGLPAAVEVGLELMNAAFYRISFGPYILEGGYWPAGFHILTIPLNGLFERSDTYDFILDLRAGDIIVRKPIRVRIEIADIAAGMAPLPRDAFSPESGTSAKAVQEGEISFYVDGKLILRSRKIAAKPSSFTFPLGGPLMPGQKPYLPPPKTDPMASGVNILDAIALAYKAIKDLVAKKPPKPSPPSYQKVSSLFFAYSRKTAEALAASARATVGLIPTRAVVLKE
jgi:hypothetical protein